MRSITPRAPDRDAAPASAARRPRPSGAAIGWRHRLRLRCRRVHSLHQFRHAGRWHELWALPARGCWCPSATWTQQLGLVGRQRALVTAALGRLISNIMAIILPPVAGWASSRGDLATCRDHYSRPVSMGCGCWRDRHCRLHLARCSARDRLICSSAFRWLSGVLTAARRDGRLLLQRKASHPRCVVAVLIIPSAAVFFTT